MSRRLIIPAALIELPSRPIGEITLVTVLGTLYIGIISTAVAMWLWNRAISAACNTLSTIICPALLMAAGPTSEHRHRACPKPPPASPPTGPQRRSRS